MPSSSQGPCSGTRGGWSGGVNLVPTVLEIGDAATEKRLSVCIWYPLVLIRTSSR